MVRKSLFTIITLCLFSTVAHAAIINYGSYSHDTDTNIVVGDGLEWLQWPLTKNMGYTQAMSFANSSYGDGWEIASPDQIAGLTNNFEFGLSWDPDNPTNTIVRSPADSGYQSGPFYSFISMFGITRYESWGNQYADWSSLGSFAIFGPAEAGSNIVNMLQVRSYGSISNINCCTFNEQVSISVDVDDWLQAIHQSHRRSIGVALVRPSAISAVPAPPAIYLMAASLGSLALARRRKNQQKVTTRPS